MLDSAFRAMKKQTFGIGAQLNACLTNVTTGDSQKNSFNGDEQCWVDDLGFRFN